MTDAETPPPGQPDGPTEPPIAPPSEPAVAPGGLPPASKPAVPATPAVEPSFSLPPASSDAAPGRVGVPGADEWAVPPVIPPTLPHSSLDEPSSIPPDGSRRDRDRSDGRARYGAAFIASAVAAVVGGVAWGLFVKFTERELRPAPVLVGLLVGLAARLAGGGRGRDTGGLHAIAAFFTLAGVVLGKYLTFAYLLAETVPVEPTVQPSPIASGVFSMDTFRLFVENPGVSFSAIDGLWVLVAVGAAMLGLVPPDGETARPRPESHNPVDKVTGGLPEPLRVAVDWIVTIVGAVAIVLLVKQFAINPYRIPSSSMEPTLHCAQPESGCEARFSDRVLANRFVYHLHDPRRGDIVVFNVPAKALQACGADGVFVKRLVGLPGETLEVRPVKGNGIVFINGKKLNEPYIESARRGAPNNDYGPKKIPAGHYFMMGDNRSSSCDSRVWGTVPRDNVIGKVFATYWPPARVSLH